MKPSLSFAAPVVLIITTALAQTPAGFLPSTNNTLTVQFGTSSITSGQYVPIELTSSSPSITYTSASANTSSSLVLMLDLDAPGGPQNNSFSPLLHWLSPLPPSTTTFSLPANQSQMSPDIPAPYFGPQPPPGSGRHRYVLLLLENPAQNFTWPPTWADFDAQNVEDRLVFNVSGFMAEGGFKLLAANWFGTENITAVDETSGAGSVESQGLGYVAYTVAGLMVVGFGLM